ncbi:MAG: HAD family phosphatase [Candidatus Marinimicrobia bacterium]|nr:HAD family phosphatase [Candidatus Neomarinimicrobiota bacterium]
MIKAVVFDMDGVVVDSEPLYQQAQVRLFAEIGVTIPEEDWKLFRGMTENNYYEFVGRRYNLSGQLGQLRRRGRQYVQELFEAQLQFMAGFTSLQRLLKGHYRLGLVTSTASDLYQVVNDKLQLGPFFEEVVCGEMTINSKPHPEPYLEIMRRLEIAPNETVVVEDSIHGLNAARDSGAWTIALTGSVPQEDMPPVHAIIDSLEELSPGYIDNLASMAAG